MRIAARPSWRAAAVIVAVVALCGAAAACGSAPVTGGDTGKITPLSCPAAFAGPAPWVPGPAQGIDSSSRMVPQQTPSQAMICAYLVAESTGGSAEPALTGTRQVAGRLDELATDLTWLPRELAGTSYACPSIGLGQQTNYLLGLTYSTGTEWVSSTDDVSDCTTTSNGRFTSHVNIGAQVAASYRVASWAPIPPPHITRTDHDPCATPRPGRLGQEQHLLPGQPTSIRLCAGTIGRSATSYQSATLSRGFQPLIDALNALPTTPTNSQCQGDGSQATFYELLASYSQGPDVLVRIDPHCAPAIDNETLQAANASTVAPLLLQLLPVK
jgi:hypothetical protein